MATKKVWTTHFFTSFFLLLLGPRYRIQDQGSVMEYNFKSGIRDKHRGSSKLT
jgi:hypothetical protein